MKKIMSAIILLFFMGIFFANFAEAKTTKVKGYFKSSGTYVAPYYKTTPNKYKFDNWSTKGNYNPYTGKKGYASPFKW